MNRFLIITWLTCVLVTTHMQTWSKPRQVLFVGNSLSSYHNMPTTVQKMLKETSEDIHIDQLTPDGEQLAGHLRTYSELDFKYTGDKIDTIHTTTKKILSQHWDYVILQEGTGGLLVPEYRQYASQPFVYKFDSLIRLCGGSAIWYQNFPMPGEFTQECCHPGVFIKMMASNKSVPLDATQQYCSVNFQSLGHQFDSLRSITARVAGSINARIAPVGEAFMQARKLCPEIELYMDNGTDGHPSEEGAYLIACVFYRVLTGKNATGIKYHKHIKTAARDKLQKVADSVVL